MSEPCAEMHLLLQADLDGELSPAEAASVAAHLDLCPACRAMSVEIAQLSRRIAREVPRERAPDGLRARVAPARRSRVLAPAAVGLALAASLALVLLPRGPGIDDELVASHVRALQPGHTLDVVSSDQHTVKPWFSGKLDFAPTVRDFAAQGFPLSGGRLDYVGSRPVAVLVYARRQHVIDVYVWPDGGVVRSASTQMNGFHIVSWSERGLALRVVSDLDEMELGQFVALLQHD